MKFCPEDGTRLVAKREPKDPLLGTLVDGRYLILERLGSGGFGTVYKVRNTRFDDIAALKVFDRRRLDSDVVLEAAARFSREARLLRRLGARSKHIVDVSDFIEDAEAGLVCFVMEFVEGSNLAQVLIRDGRLELPRALRLARQLFQTLNVTHHEGVIHRDLKLENLMVTEDLNLGGELLKVLDFGIAKIVSQHTLADPDHGGMGTPGFVAPEQFRSPDSIDGRADLFAGGVVLHLLLTRREPWTNKLVSEPTDPLALLTATLEREPTPARRWSPDLPEEVEALIQRLLSKDPNARPPDAAVVDAELARIEGRLDRSRAGVAAAATRRWTFTLRDRVRLLVARTTGRTSEPHDALTRVAPPRGIPETRHRTDVAARRFRLSRSSAVRGALGIGLTSVGVLAWALFRPAPALTPEQLTEEVARGTVREVRPTADHLHVELEDGDRSERRRVSLAGLELHTALNNLAQAGVPLGAGGRPARVVLSAPLAMTVEGSPDLLSLALRGSEGEVCSPCPAGTPLGIGPGWYELQVPGADWILDSLEVRVLRGAFADEVLRGSGSFFVPGGARIELAALSSPTPVREALARGMEAIGAGRYLTAPGEDAAHFARLALEEDPSDPRALSFLEEVVSHLRRTIQVSVASDDFQQAAEVVARCRERLPDTDHCRALAELVPEREPPPPSPPPVARARTLALENWSVVDGDRGRMLRMAVRYAVESPARDDWCLAVRYSDAATAADGLAGREVVAQQRDLPVDPGVTSGESSFQVPVEELQVPLTMLNARASIDARVAVWSNPCDAVGTRAAPLGESDEPSRICLVRSAAGIQLDPACR